jgi:predicted DNA-binding transcriptional regulator AlpA
MPRRRQSEITKRQRRREREAKQRCEARERRAALRQISPADQQRLPFTLFRVNRLATIFDCDRATIWRWRRDGVLPEPISVGGITGWTHSQIEHLIAQRQQQATE